MHSSIYIPGDGAKILSVNMSELTEMLTSPFLSASGPMNLVPLKRDRQTECLPRKKLAKTCNDKIWAGNTSLHFISCYNFCFYLSIIDCFT